MAETSTLSLRLPNKMKKRLQEQADSMNTTISNLSIMVLGHALDHHTFNFNDDYPKVHDLPMKAWEDYTPEELTETTLESAREADNGDVRTYHSLADLMKDTTLHD